MMSRSFTTREKVLLLILAVLILVGGYYLVVYNPSMAAIADANERIDAARTQLLVETARNDRRTEMLNELDAMGNGAVEELPEVPDYDNAQNVVKFLYSVLSKTKDYNLSFNPVVCEEYLASRNIEMTFTSTDFRKADDIVEELYHSPYRCRIEAITMKEEEQKDGSICTQVRLSITFYEFLPEPVSPAVKEPAE